MDKIEDKLISFQNLLIVAAADGDIEDDEKQILIDIGSQMGLHPHMLKSIVSAESLELQAHANQEDNLSDLGDMLTVAASDGIILTEEYETCLRFATLCGISQEKVDEMLQTALAQITAEEEDEEIAG